MSDVNEEREEERFVDKRAASRAAAAGEGRREQGEVPAQPPEGAAEPVDELASERWRTTCTTSRW